MAWPTSPLGHWRHKTATTHTSSSRVPKEWRTLMAAAMAFDAVDHVSIVTEPERQLLPAPTSPSASRLTEEVIYSRRSSAPVALNDQMKALKRVLDSAGIFVRTGSTPGGVSETRSDIGPGWRFGTERLAAPDGVEVEANFVTGPLQRNGDEAPEGWRRVFDSYVDYTNIEIRLAFGRQSHLYMRVGPAHVPVTAVAKAVCAGLRNSGSSARPLDVARALPGSSRLITGNAASVLRGEPGSNRYQLDSVEVTVSRDAIAGIAARIADLKASPLCSDGTFRPLPMSSAEAQHKLVSMRYGDTLLVRSDACGRFDIRIVGNQEFWGLLDQSTGHTISGVTLNVGPPDDFVVRLEDSRNEQNDTFSLERWLQA